jgi:formylglycine-generating enzyme required for sulfatase activity
MHTRISLTGNFSFGILTVNQTATRTLSISNTGIGTLTVSGISYPAGFSGNWTGGTIAPNATQNVTISFRPLAEQAYTGSITVNSTATAGTPLIAASGSGAHSRTIGLTGNLSFGTLTINQTANRTLSIRNSGTGSLAVSGISYPAGFSGSWSGGTIAPAATQNVTVTFRPVAEQDYNGHITVNSTATAGTSAISTSGSGAHTRIIGLTGNLSFGNQTVYRTANRILSISNTGTGNLTVNGITYPAGFSGNWSGTIAPGATQNVTVQFSPTVAQTNPTVGQSFSGNANVASNATGGSGVRPVSGAAVVPKTTLVDVNGGNLSSTTVSTFKIGKFEVTWDEWKAVRGWAVAYGGYSDLANVGDGKGRNTAVTDEDSFGSYPVTKVSWCDVVKWCNAKSEMENLTPVYLNGNATYKTGDVTTVTLRANATGYRLPSEPEWEWAARGGTSGLKNFIYSGSNSTDEVAWYQSNSGGTTKGVGLKKANELGIFDMSGNVVEWCWDEAESARPIRGGSFERGASDATVAYRAAGISPTDRFDTIGFRVVRGGGVIAPAISHPGRTDGQVGSPYSYQIQSKNKPTSFGATPLPAGLSINSTTGRISGTPTAAGLFTANLTASNAGGTSRNDMQFHIAPVMSKLINLPASISFGNRKINQTANLALNITNPTSESLQLQLISYPSGSVFSGEFYPITLTGAGSSKNFNVTFTPTQATNYSGNITVQFAMSLNSIPRVFWVNIPVSGSGTP